jgi:hypothetical protein
VLSRVSAITGKWYPHFGQGSASTACSMCKSKALS